jgi:hypothetical protein
MTFPSTLFAARSPHPLTLPVARLNHGIIETGEEKCFSLLKDMCFVSTVTAMSAVTGYCVGRIVNPTTDAPVIGAIIGAGTTFLLTVACLCRCASASRNAATVTIAEDYREILELEAPRPL